MLQEVLLGGKSPGPRGRRQQECVWALALCRTALEEEGGSEHTNFSCPRWDFGTLQLWGLCCPTAEPVVIPLRGCSRMLHGCALCLWGMEGGLQNVRISELNLGRAPEQRGQHCWDSPAVPWNGLCSLFAGTGEGAEIAPRSPAVGAPLPGNASKPPCSSQQALGGSRSSCPPPAPSAAVAGEKEF